MDDTSSKRKENKFSMIFLVTLVTCLVWNPTFVSSFHVNISLEHGNQESHDNNNSEGENQESHDNNNSEGENQEDDYVHLKIVQQESIDVGQCYEELGKAVDRPWICEQNLIKKLCEQTFPDKVVTSAKACILKESLNDLIEKKILTEYSELAPTDSNSQPATGHHFYQCVLEGEEEIKLNTIHKLQSDANDDGLYNLILIQWDENKKPVEARTLTIEMS